MMKTKNTPKLSRHEKRLVRICCEKREEPYAIAKVAAGWADITFIMYGEAILELAALVRKLSKKGKV